MREISLSDIEDAARHIYDRVIRTRIVQLDDNLCLKLESLQPTGPFKLRRRAGVPCSVMVPDTAPATKVDALKRLCARVVPTPSRNAGGQSRRTARSA
jgi:threonine dehydratase